MFMQMRHAGVQANIVTYNALIRACEKGMQWERAVEVFALMQDAGV